MAFFQHPMLIGKILNKVFLNLRDGAVVNVKTCTFSRATSRNVTKGTSIYYVITKGGGRGSAKCLRLLTWGEGG